ALLYNAAQAHRVAGNKQRALLLYQNYLRVYGKQVKNRDEVERHIQTLQRAIDSEVQSQTAPPTETIGPSASSTGQPRPQPATEPRTGTVPPSGTSAAPATQPSLTPAVA